MDAVKFVKEYLRICTKVDECEDCPVYKTDFCTVPAKERSQESAEEIVELVEEWSAAHPRKTRQTRVLDAGGEVMDNLLQNLASALWITIGIQILVWLKRWNKKLSDLYDELKGDVERWND